MGRTESGPILALDRLSFLDSEGKVGYRYGDDGVEIERMDYLELIARVTSHIPDKGPVMVRYYGLFANAHRGKVRKVYEVDPMLCPNCGCRMKIVAFIREAAVVDRIIDHLKLTFVAEKPPPLQAAFQLCPWAADPPAEYFP